MLIMKFILVTITIVYLKLMFDFTDTCNPNNDQHFNKWTDVFSFHFYAPCFNATGFQMVCIPDARASFFWIFMWIIMGTLAVMLIASFLIHITFSVQWNPSIHIHGYLRNPWNPWPESMDVHGYP